MSKTALLNPYDMPNSVGIVQNNEFLYSPHLIAVTACCIAQIHFGHKDDVRICSSCQTTITFPTVGRAESSFISLNSNVVHIRDWISHWTGLNSADIEVVITK